MKCTVENVSPCKRLLRIEVPGEDVERAYERAVAEVRHDAQIHGFRKGKVPRDVLERRFQKTIAADVLEHLISENVVGALKETNLQPISDPRLTGEPKHALFHSSEERRRAGLSYEVEFEVYPKIEIKKCKGLRIRKKAASVTDEDVNKTLEDLRVRTAVIAPVEGRGAREGDVVAVDVVQTVEGKTRSKETLDVFLNADLPPAFREALTGMEPGAVKEFSVSYPADHPDKKMAGKTSRVRAEMKAVRERRLPQLDDEWAKQLSNDASSLAEFQAQLRKDLDAAQEREVRKDMIEQILTALVTGNPVDVPEVLLERQLDAQLETAAEALAARGIDPARAAVDWRKARESGRESAREYAHATLLLKKISDQEKITATEDDIAREFVRMAASLRAAPDDLRRHYEKDERATENLRARVRREKTLDFLLSHATIEPI